MDAPSGRITATLWLRRYDYEQVVPTTMGPPTASKSKGNLWWEYEMYQGRPDETQAALVTRLQQELEDRYPKETLERYDWSLRNKETGEELTTLPKKLGYWVVP